jgi:hypothetical protein
LKKIKIIHPKVLNVLLLLKHHQFASNFEQWNFASNGAYVKKWFDNPNYCVTLVIFQNYSLLRSVKPLRWPLRLWMYQGDNNFTIVS